MTTDTATAAQRALDFITAATAAGRTVHVATMTKVVALSAKTVARWAASGRPVVKLGKTGNLLLASGRSYVCIATPTTVLVGLTAV